MTESESIIPEQVIFLTTSHEPEDHPEPVYEGPFLDALRYSVATESSDRHLL